MYKDFIADFYSNRDDTLEGIIASATTWHDFLKFWSRNLGYFTLDNLINIYSYFPTGSTFKTFEDWNNERIERRIKKGSHGVPILKDNNLMYVFDISQTWGKPLVIWQYSKKNNEYIAKLYSIKSQLIEKDLTMPQILKMYIENNISKNYSSLNNQELKLISLSVENILLEKIGFANNYEEFQKSFNYVSNMSKKDLLNCLQIVNKETCNFYRELFNNVKALNAVNQEIIQLSNSSQLLNNSDLEGVLLGLEAKYDIDYELLRFMYDKYSLNQDVTYQSKQASHIESPFQEEKSEESTNHNQEETRKYDFYDLESAYEYLKGIDSDDKELKDLLNEIADEMGYDDNEHYNIENDLLNKIVDYLENKSKVTVEQTNKEDYAVIDGQLSLFESREKLLAEKICDIFNSFDTKFQNTFEIREVELGPWEHIKSKKRNLSILLTSPIANMGDNAFTYFNSDKTDETKLNNGIINNAFIQSLYKDKDFSIRFSPELIHIFWNNFDEKRFDLSIPSTKTLNQSENTDKELENIDSEISDITDKENNTEVNYKVPTAEIIPTRDGLEANAIDERNYNSEGEEIKEEYPPINYHISDEKVATSFGPKARFEDNVKAIELLKKLEQEDRNATKEEQDILSRYVGWGGIADAFDERKDNWKNENGRLKLLLNEEEYKAAAHSTLSSFYTPNIAIDGIYKILKQFGFKKGNILEPSCGIGNFFGRLPDEFGQSKLYGVEIDNISSRIARKLYPKAKIETIGYENSKVADEFFDIAIGNVPFGNNTVYDKRYKDRFLIHDYFFQKTLDKVRDGGIIAFITTDGTLDKKDTKVREYLAKRAEFLGAIRLPNNTFIGNANTKVTSDVIFLKKRNELKQDISDEKWIYTSEYEDGITINNYYIDNPNMMLGKMELQSTAYGYDNTLSPIDEDINVLLTKAIEKLPHNIYEPMALLKIMLLLL